MKHKFSIYLALLLASTVSYGDSMISTTCSCGSCGGGSSGCDWDWDCDDCGCDGTFVVGGLLFSCGVCMFVSFCTFVLSALVELVVELTESSSLNKISNKKVEFKKRKQKIKTKISDIQNNATKAIIHIYIQSK